MQPYFIGRGKLSNGGWDRASVSMSDHAGRRRDRHIILCYGQGGHGAVIRRVQWR
jgi:hypothetical protein